MLCGLLLFDISVTWSWLVDCWLVKLADVFLSLFSTGNRFCYLSLTALPVDYKALGKKKQNKTEHTLLSSFWTFFFGFSSASFEAKTLDETPVPEKRRNVSSPLRPGKQQHHASVSVLQPHWGMCGLKAPALQSPSKLLVVLFICIPILHSCTSLLHPCGSKWPHVTGFTMDARPGATTQNKASSVSCLRYALLK